MNGTYAKVICDSVSPHGQRLTTIEARFHRWVLPEVNTHRKFSRNSASSRAIPVTKILEKVIADPAFPVVWTSEQSGMQGGEELTGNDLKEAKRFWFDAYQFMVGHVQKYVEDHPDPKTRLHKSRLNRLLEPFMYHTIIITTTDFQGFWDQRISKLAEPEIELVARKMKEAYDASRPRTVLHNYWHLPYITGDDLEETYNRNYDDVKAFRVLRMISAARCARTSYLTHDGKRDWNADLDLYSRLVSATPPHWSPLEHVATPTPHPSQHLKSNFDGWVQLRHLIEHLREVDDERRLRDYEVFL